MRRSRGVLAVASVVATAAAGLLILLVALGQLGFVTTHGVSMNPVYYQGDLVVVVRAPSYRVGEIVAYRMPGKRLVVLHRIVGGGPDGFVFKGDNNQSTDLTHPTAAQLVGHAVLHIPQAGAWLGGWHTNVPLAATLPFAGNGEAHEVDLHLSALEGRASAAATATGMPAGAITVAVTAAVQPAIGSQFRAVLTLNLTPLRLTLPGGVSSLTADNPSATTHSGTRPRTLSPFGRRISTVSARGISLALIASALITLTWLTRLMRRIRRANEQTAIAHRYPQLLVPIDSAPQPVPSQQIVDVPNFPALAKLAEHYGLLILQSHAPEGETFQTVFEGTAYRYRALRGANPRTRASDLFGPQPDRRAGSRLDGQNAGMPGTDRRSAPATAPQPGRKRRLLGGLTTSPLTAVRRSAR